MARPAEPLMTDVGNLAAFPVSDGAAGRIVG
jgi:hypothetical protein